MKNTCFAYGGENFFDKATCKNLIELQQTGFDKFTVVYGLEVKTNLTYEKACSELGRAIMHWQASNGHLDNRTRKEAKEQGDSKPYFDDVGD